MGLINKPFTHNPSNNNTTAAESAKVNANDDTIYSLVNGNISDANIAPAAAIQQTKILGLGNSLNNLALRTVSSIVENTNENVISNTATETAIYADTIPGGVLTAVSCLFGHINLIIQSILTGSSASIRLYYGGGTGLFFEASITNSSGGTLAGLIAVRVAYQIHSRNTLVDQGAEGELRLAPVNAGLTVGGLAGNFSTLNMVPISINSAIAQTLNCNILWSVASPSNVISSFGHYVWRPRA